MNGLELVFAALAAGSSELATSAVRDAYAGLRDRLRSRLGGQERAVRVLEAGQSTEPGVWQAQLGDDLDAAGAGADKEVLAAARAVLALTDPDGTRAGKYTVSGDHTVNVTTNYGAAAGTMNAPVNITYGQPPPIPPSEPVAS